MIDGMINKYIWITYHL